MCRWRSRTSNYDMEEEQQQQAEHTPSRQILHQRQRLQLCLLHALNNLFQGETSFSRFELNKLAISLAGAVQHGGPFSRLFNSHFNIITGNYDANVLMIALQNRGAEAVWHDRRKGAAAIDLNASDGKLIGIILNHPTERFSGVWKGRHWSALRNIRGVWYDLDSDLAAPVPVGKEDEDVKQFLEQSLAGGSEAFLVYRSDGNGKNLEEMESSKV